MDPQLFRMFRDRSSMTLLTMGHRLFCLRDGIHEKEGDCNAMNHSLKNNYARYIFFTHKELNSG
jgi:hypothetical protein